MAGRQRYTLGGWADPDVRAAGRVEIHESGDVQVGVNPVGMQLSSIPGCAAELTVAGSDEMNFDVIRPRQRERR